MLNKITLSDSAVENIKATLRDAVLESAKDVSEEYTDEKFDRLVLDSQAYEAFVSGQE
ncbi:MAG TPA: hypothetical protein VMO76_14820 [Candidatus Udaeobacter sp.]|nr:hypothetical protein [Candidatus Udaeobacter sp.]